MGDTNEIEIGANAQVGQVIAGNNNTQIGQQNVYYGDARPTDARFSLPRAPGDFTGRTLEIETLVKQLTSEKRVAITGLDNG